MSCAIKERPILFTGPMVRALLDGSKTQTRRIAKEFAGRDDLDAILKRFPSQNGCPHGQPGDRLWVKESYRFVDSLDGDSATRVADRCLDAGYSKPWAPIQYEADGATRDWHHVSTPPHDGPPKAGKLRPNIFLPRWASRILLEITGVRVERLQDISEADAWAEGIEAFDGALEDMAIFEMARRTGRPFEDAATTYAALWESINGAGSWDANPWAWVIEFRRITPP